MELFLRPRVPSPLSALDFHQGPVWKRLSVRDGGLVDHQAVTASSAPAVATALLVGFELAPEPGP